jgi:hypothetical protein
MAGSSRDVRGAARSVNCSKSSSSRASESRLRRCTFQAFLRRLRPTEPLNKRPPLIRWGALLGESLFNFRSALDHLAYDLAVAYSGFPLQPVVEKGSAFPIFHRQAAEKSELDTRIGAVHPDARRLIEMMQPYGRPDRAALKYLDVLHNFDKHRTLHLVVAVSKGFSHFGELDIEYFNFGALEHGDVLIEIPLTTDPERQQKPHFMFGVGFSKSGPAADAPDVGQTLRWIGQHIEKRVIPPLLPYL